MNIYSHFMNYMFLNTKHDIFNHKKSKWHKNVQRFSHKTWILDHKILIFDHKLKIIKHKTHIFLITNRYFSQKSYFYQNIFEFLIKIWNFTSQNLLTCLIGIIKWYYSINTTYKLTFNTLYFEMWSRWRWFEKFTRFTDVTSFATQI